MLSAAVFVLPSQLIELSLLEQFSFVDGLLQESDSFCVRFCALYRLLPSVDLALLVSLRSYLSRPASKSSERPQPTSQAASLRPACRRWKIMSEWASVDATISTRAQRRDPRIPIPGRPQKSVKRNIVQGLKIRLSRSMHSIEQMR